MSILAQNTKYCSDTDYPLAFIGSIFEVMGLLDRLGNGIVRVVDAIDEGSKHGVAGMVMGGAAALTGEAFVQPITVGMSLIGKGDAADRYYQKNMYDATRNEVKSDKDDFIKASFSLVGGMACNVKNTPGAVWDVARGAGGK